MKTQFKKLIQIFLRIRIAEQCRYDNRIRIHEAFIGFFVPSTKNAMPKLVQNQSSQKLGLVFERSPKLAVNEHAALFTPTQLKNAKLNPGNFQGKSFPHNIDASLRRFRYEKRSPYFELFRNFWIGSGRSTAPTQGDEKSYQKGSVRSVHSLSLARHCIAIMGAVSC